MINLYNNNTINSKGLQVLKDVNRQGREIDWQGKKNQTLELSESYTRLEMESKARRTEGCGTFLEFRLTQDERLRLTRANFCKVRLCPMCAWRRSLKIFGQVSKVLDYADLNYNFRYLFLTLTVKNVYSEELEATIRTMSKAFNSMTRIKLFKDNIKGYFRALEVTYNKIDNSYHPHYHVILAVSPSYFSRGYISQEKWTSLWKKYLKVDYTPIVHIQAVRKNSKKEVSEIAKYTVKSDDYLIRDEHGDIDGEKTDKVIYALDKALAYKRLVSFGFTFKQIHQLLSLDDAEEGDLTYTDNEEIREDLTNVILRYNWNIGLKNYTIVEITQAQDEGIFLQEPHGK